MEELKKEAGNVLIKHRNWLLALRNYGTFS